jgi:hypothetical protein
MKLLNYLKRNTAIGEFVRKDIIGKLVIVNPELATKIMFRLSQGYSLNLRKPKTLNEKIQYLKLNDYYENPNVTMAVDKYRVREYLNDYLGGCIISWLMIWLEKDFTTQWMK